MSIIGWIKGVWHRLFRKEIEQKFNADIQLSDVMEAWISKFYMITSGKPYWIDKEDDIESINFAGFIDDVTASLVTLDLGIEMPDTPRGQYLQEQADYVLQVIQDKVSEGLGNCGLMFKPNGNNVDYIEPGNFAPTAVDSNGNILGCVFQDRIERDKTTYTKLEWHRFEDGTYRITNYAYKTKGTGNPQAGIGDPCELTEVDEWKDIEPDVWIMNIDKPIFAYFKNPAPNRIDRSSSLGVPIWHNALKELKDLDIAWSRKSGEVEDSKHMTFVDDSSYNLSNKANGSKKVILPRFFKQVDLGAPAGEIHEHVATMLTEQRIADINATLAMISTKCGFSQGFFVLDEKTGRMTATQVEADDQQTIDTINNIHEALKESLMNLFYGLNVMEDLYGSTPAEKWDRLKEQIVISYHDFTVNPDEDRARALQLTNNNFYPKWYYLVNYEGLTEEEARKLVEEAEPKQEESLFGEE